MVMKFSLLSLVEWAKSAMLNGEFKTQHLDEVRDAVARLGVADVRARGLTREDCEQVLNWFVYSAQVNIFAT
jgi:hypothetical protein